jgi:hypothetical protein
METLSEAVDRLRAAGYRDSFRAEAGGIRALGADRLYAPEQLVIDEVVRFEGTSDPADEAILFALRADDGAVRGTFVSGYGPTIEPEKAELVRRLPAARARRDHAPRAAG